MDLNFRISLNKILITAGVVALVFIISFFIWWNKEITVTGLNPWQAQPGPKSSVSGLECANADRRPLAVMMAGDPETRPLAGIGQADIVFEMPVTPDGITRFMAVFQCEDPKEIGSIRSAREDFIPLAAGLGAIYAHWGGEKEALEKLDSCDRAVGIAGRSRQRDGRRRGEKRSVGRSGQRHRRWLVGICDRDRHRC